MLIPVVVTSVAKLTGVPLLNPCAVLVTVSPASCSVTATASEIPVVPVTYFPTVNPVVLAMVTVVDPEVVVPDKAAAVSTP